jgi:hypothetical protein
LVQAVALSVQVALQLSQLATPHFVLLLQTKVEPQRFLN